MFAFLIRVRGYDICPTSGQTKYVFIKFCYHHLVNNKACYMCFCDYHATILKYGISRYFSMQKNSKRILGQKVLFQMPLLDMSLKKK